MSEEAPFADAAVANDVDDRSRTFLSYYTEGAAIALGLDLSLRERSQGRISLDDYMRRLWNEFGAPPAPRPGYVAHPYTLAALRRALATVSGDPAFADEFFDRYIEGREVPDYAHLLGLAGYALRRRAPDRGWAGDVPFAETARGLLVGGSRRGGSERLVPFGTPAYDAGVDAGDLIVSIDGQPATAARWAALADRTPGGRVSLVVERRDGTRVGTVMTLVPDPALDIVPAERLGTLTDSERAFRRAWLGATGRAPDAARAAGG